MYNTYTINFKENLNHQQLKAVEESDGPSLVLAGAGSGKTRVLIYRLAYILEKGINQQNILLVTFTNKAAKEMLHRAESLLKSTVRGLWAGTFHHIANRILRTEAEILGYTPYFTIIDKEDAKDLISDCFYELKIDKSNFPKENIISNILCLAINCQKEIDTIVFHFYPYLEEHISGIKRVIAYYEKKKKSANLMDFDDLLLNWLRLLKNEEICQKYSAIFQYVLVDEYQDTNKLQFEILKRLSSHHKNILVVGDDAQSIYSFRGAEINNMLDFPKIFPRAKIFRLEINYRSSPQILYLANEIIKQNREQFPKTLKAIRESSCEPIAIAARDVYEQAKFVSNKILQLQNEGIPINETAVLFRSRFQALELEVELLKKNIPYIVRGGIRFFEQAHIKDILAYLKITINPQDDLSFRRAISLYSGIGRSFANKIWTLFNEKKSFQDIEKELPKKPKEGFKEFVRLYQTLTPPFPPFNKGEHGGFGEALNPEKAIKTIMGFYKDYCYLNFDNYNERIQDVEELSKMASTFPTVRKFLLELAGLEGFKGEILAANKDDVLVLSTIHQAKGLEWRVVFIIGFSNYEFPHPQALESDKSLEEERRLFYVAATRAKSELYITYPQNKYTAKNGLILCQPSLFLRELPKSCYREEIQIPPASIY